MSYYRYNPVEMLETEPVASVVLYRCNQWDPSCRVYHRHMDVVITMDFAKRVEVNIQFPHFSLPSVVRGAV